MMKKFDSQRSVTFLYHGLCILIIMLFSACADGDDPVSHVSEASEVSETGSVAFRVVWKDVPDTESASGKTERKLNCAESDVETVEANVYDENDENGEPIADGGPWSCSLGKASIEDVPAGSQRRIVVRGKDSEDRVLHQGEAEDVRVLAGQSTPPVLIEMRRVAPEVFINSPSENKVFTEGETITFSGSATDPEDGGDLSLAWTISMGGESVDSATGTSFTRDNLAQGDYTAELTATDSGGLTDTASVMFTVKGNTPPSVTIIRPSANEVVFTEGEAITFDGSANDPEDGELTGESLVWTLSVNGYPLSESIIGGSFEKDNLDSGNYAAKLTATDRGGLTKSASVSFTVKGNSPPSVTIIRPSANEVVFTEGEAITFDGSASDPDEDGADLSLAWGIRQDESQIYSTEGGSFEKNDLSPGIYTATLTATDSRGATGSASVSFMVKGNSPPSVTIIRPSANEVVFTEGETVTFSGSASDPEDGADLSLAWEIRQGDSLEYSTTEGSFSKNDLTSGTYTATLTATDSRGAPGSASISFIVNKGNQPPVLSEIGAQSVNEGELLRFSVSATDPDDGDMLTFTTGNLPDGVEFDKSEENPDTYIFSWTSYSNDIDYNVTFTVTDDGTPNRSDSETVMITVNKKPFVKITNPSGQESFFKGDEISFSGSAQDSEDVELSGENFRWEISQNTDPMHSDTGESFVKSDLGLGTYTVTLKVTDSGGAIGEASVSFTVQDQVVTFPDANLEAAIRVAIQKPDGDIYASDLEGLTELFAVGREIENLEGLEYCTNLTLLNLGTTGETSNSIADISPLTELTSLTSLGLGDNQISDISALASLTSLTSLGLRYNQISDISELASLTALTSLDLSYNQISDISPLVSNMGIGDGDNVYLGNNPLSDTSCAVYIPELEERGAMVTHDCSDNFSPVLDAVGTQYVNEGQLLEFTLSATVPRRETRLPSAQE